VRDERRWEEVEHLMTALKESKQEPLPNPRVHHAKGTVDTLGFAQPASRNHGAPPREGLLREGDGGG
jgi:hypothetical protein